MAETSLGVHFMGSYRNVEKRINCLFCVCFLLADNEALFDHDSVDQLEEDHSLVTDAIKDPTSRDFEQHYDMLHDIDQEKDIYRLRVSK